MATVKTAISLDASLLRQAEEVAQEQKKTRSGLFRDAVREYVERYENRKLLAELNAAYGDGPDPEDLAFLEAAKHNMADILHEWS